VYIEGVYHIHQNFSRKQSYIKNLLSSVIAESFVDHEMCSSLTAERIARLDQRLAPRRAVPLALVENVSAQAKQVAACEANVERNGRRQE